MRRKVSSSTTDSEWSGLDATEAAHLPADGSKGAVVVGDDRPFVPTKL